MDFVPYVLASGHAAPTKAAAVQATEEVLEMSKEALPVEATLRSIDQMEGSEVSELIPHSTYATERLGRVAPSEANDELRRWYSALKFCPLATFDNVES